jgi:hypothetical protein
MNNQNSTLFTAYAKVQRIRTAMTTMLASTFVFAQVVPTYATIDNTANAVGTFGGIPANYGSSSLSVPVAPAAPSLVVAKSGAAPVDVNSNGVIDAGDTITYTVVVTNNGNVTLNSVLPVEQSTKFNTVAGTGTLSAWTPTVGINPVTLAPSASKTFTAVYTLSAADADRGAQVAAAGVVNTAGATGTPTVGAPYVVPPAGYSTASVTIPQTPKLTISKTEVLAKAGGNVVAGKAELGDTITYTYAVTNIGNVAMTGVTIKDMHGTPPVQVGTGALVPGVTGETLISDGAMAPGTVSSDAAVNGIYDTLQPGAVVNFTWAHVVTQAEVDHG